MEKIVKPSFKVGISGHRDLLPEQDAENMIILEGHLRKLRRDHPDRELRIVTPLADGADRLIVKVAQKLGISFEIILPMPKELYVKDFNLASKEEFDALMQQAIIHRTVEICPGNTLESIAEYSNERDRQYRRVGKEVCDVSDYMIFMSDGKPNGKTGGTEDIKAYARKQGIESYSIRCVRMTDKSSEP